MASPSPGYSIIVQVQAPATFTATSDLAAVVAEAGAAIAALDIVEASHQSNIINLACGTTGKQHSHQVQQAIEAAADGFEVLSLSDRTFHMHQGGKIQTTSKVISATRLIFPKPIHQVWPGSVRLLPKTKPVLVS